MVDTAGAPVLAILTRAPSSGGKTRLFASLGIPPDLTLLAALFLDTFNGGVASAERLVVAVTPASACDEIKELVDGDTEVFGQVEGDLGARMRATMTALFERGAGAVVLIGSDLPHITPAVITEAYERVMEDSDTLVLGPASDGGYYLIASRRVPDVFLGITWGSGQVLTQTTRAAVADGYRVHLLPTMTDVDTPDDLCELAKSGQAPRTAAWLDAQAGRIKNLGVSPV